MEIVECDDHISTTIHCYLNKVNTRNICNNAASLDLDYYNQFYTNSKPTYVLVIVEPFNSHYTLSRFRAQLSNIFIKQKSMTDFFLLIDSKVQY